MAIIEEIPKKNMKYHKYVDTYSYQKICTNIQRLCLEKSESLSSEGRQSFPLYRRSNFDTYRTPEYAERPSTSIVWDTVIIIVTIVIILSTIVHHQSHHQSHHLFALIISLHRFCTSDRMASKVANL